jgi:predicted TIM-barrel fold metal-dependent hydrolase
MHWDPLWSAIEDAGLVLSFHSASGDMSTTWNPEILAQDKLSVVYARGTTQMLMETGKQLADLLMSRILVRHPKLQVVCAESGLGWLPFVLDASDYHYLRADVRAEHPEFTEMPSTYFKNQCAVTFWFEEATPELVAKVGADNLLFETDFPHTTGLWGKEVHNHVELCAGKATPEVREKILRGNASRIYKLA